MQQEEQEARKEKKEAEAARREEEEAAKVSAETTNVEEKKQGVEEDKHDEDARMTKAQLNELAEALSILTAKSSIVKERDELHALLEDNLLTEAVRVSRLFADVELMAWLRNRIGEPKTPTHPASPFLSVSEA